MLKPWKKAAFLSVRSKFYARLKPQFHGLIMKKKQKHMGPLSENES